MLSRFFKVTESSFWKHINTFTRKPLSTHKQGLRAIYLGRNNVIPTRGLHLTSLRPQQRPQYEYDPSTDTFRPKPQQGFTQSSAPPQGKERWPFVKFMRSWTRTLFLITGGIAWGAIIFVTLFVDIKENSDFVFPSHELDDEVRMLVFYNLAHGKDDLARLVSMYEGKNKGENKFEDVHNSMEKKQEVLMKTIDELKENDMVVDILGNPVQLSGYRVANKIGELIQNFQEFAANYKENKNCLISDKGSNEAIVNTWTAECFLEGSKGVALLDVSFRRENTDSPWVLDNFSLQRMEKSGQIYSGDESMLKFS